MGFKHDEENGNNEPAGTGHIIAHRLMEPRRSHMYNKEGEQEGGILFAYCDEGMHE